MLDSEAACSTSQASMATTFDGWRVIVEAKFKQLTDAIENFEHPHRTAAVDDQEVASQRRPAQPTDADRAEREPWYVHEHDE